MAIQHVVLSKFRASVDEDGKVKAFEVARGLLSTIPQAKNAYVGPPIHSRLSRGYNYGMVVTFDDNEALGAYLAHPQHAVLIKALNPYTEAMMVYQIEVPNTAPRL